MDVPASNILVLLFRIWQAESHVQPESGFGQDETVPECRTVLLESFQLEQVSICSSAFPIHQSSTHRARDSTKINQTMVDGNQCLNHTSFIYLQDKNAFNDI